MSDFPGPPASAPRVSWDQARARRLERHALATPAKGTPAAGIVEALCGAHAQVLSAAELSIALRMDGVTRTDVRHALWTERSLVKTFGPRGTVHLLPTRDLPLWTGALSALAEETGAVRGQRLLTPAQTDEVVEGIAEALADAELTVDELTEDLSGRVGSWAADPVMEAFQGKWPRWRAATALAAHRGALCFGPNRGRKATYTNPHRWLPGFRPTDGPAALGTLLARYLHSYGPATPQHFAQWLAAPPRWAGALFGSRASAGAIQQVDLDGTPAWVNTGDTAPPTAAPAGLRLLPYFDAYSVGSHPRERVFPGRAAERALAGSQAGNFPVLLIGGTVAGVWHQRRSGRKIHITVEPLDASVLNASRRHALDDEVQRLGVILEGSPLLTVGTVTVGAHA